MNILRKEIEEKVSEYIETTLKSHLHLDGTKINMLVHEDILFDYEHQWNILKAHNPNFASQLCNIGFIKRVKQELERIDVSLHLSNVNTIFLNTCWQFSSGGYARTGIFYTNTNLLVEFSTMSPFNGTATSLRLYTEDKQVDFHYGHFNYDGSNAHGQGPAEDKLQQCKTKIYKYIHPRIYLDYYMHCATEQDMNELIYSTRLINLINDLQMKNESYKKEIREVKDQYEKEVYDKSELKKYSDMTNEECKKYYNMTMDNENAIFILQENNEKLKSSLCSLNIELDSIKTENEELKRKCVIKERKNYTANLLIFIITCIFTFSYFIIKN